MRETVVVYCEDCPSRWLCHPDTGHDCAYVRRIQAMVEKAPPLTPEQAQKIVTLLWG